MGEQYEKRESGRLSFMSTECSAAGDDAFEAPYDVVNTSGISYESYLVGVKNPHYKAQIAAGLDASSNMSAHKVKILNQTAGHLEVKCNVASLFPNPGLRRKSGKKGDIAMPNLIQSGDPPTSSAVNKAAGDFYERLRDANSTFKGLVAIGEGHQSLQMIGTRGEQILSKLTDYVSSLRRAKRRWKLLKDLRKALADNYLELVFGWLPLASDISDAIDAGHRIRPIRKIVRGRGSDSVAGDVLYSGHTNGVLTYQTSSTTRAWARAQYYSLVTLEQSLSGRVADFGLTTREFVPTLYEICPWSFLLDYFGNLNEIIDAGCYASLLNGPVNLTTTVGWTQTVAAFGAQPSGTYNFEVSVISQPSTITLEQSSVQRQTDCGNPMVLPRFKNPFVKPRKIANMAALLAAQRYQYYP